MSKVNLIFGVIFLVFLSACSGAERQPKRVWQVSVNGEPVPTNNAPLGAQKKMNRSPAAAPQVKSEPAKDRAEKQSLAAKLWVWRADGSKQCGMAKGVKPQKAAQVMKGKGISVFESRSGNDGQMHMSACGAPTGATVELLIQKKDLEKAQKWGFRQKEDQAQ